MSGRRLHARDGASDGPVPTNLQFIAAVERIAERRGWRKRPSPADLVRWWASLVEHCEQRYNGTIYEYDDALSVRDLIQSVIDDAEAASLSEAQVWGAEIARWDARFKAILVPLPSLTREQRGGVPVYPSAETTSSSRTFRATTAW